jgi:hypothetical protein
MGLLDDIIAQQSGGGMLGGLPASWQYTNPESLTPVQKQMMGLVGTQNPDQVGFNPLPATPGGFPTGGTAPIASANNPSGAPPVATPAQPFPMGTDPMTAGGMLPPPVPTFGAGASPVLFANPPGSTPGNPALPSPATAPIVAAGDDSEEDPPNAPASPLALGNYQMPRIGSAAAFTPDPAALPVNARPAQGQLPTASDTAPSIGDKLMTGFQNWQHGGNLVGSIVAAVTGKRNDAVGVATDQASQVANMTARVLIAKGVDPQIALAAVQPGNKEALDTLWKQAFGPQTLTSLGEGYVTDKNGKVSRAYTPDTKDNFGMVQTGEDGLGRKTFQKLNKATGEMTPISGAASGGDTGGGLGDMNKTGAEYLATVPKAQAGIMQGMVDGTIQPPSSFALAKPYWQAMLAGAKNLDPNFDANTWTSRHKMSNDVAASGNSSMGGILSNGKSSFKHLAEYTESAADLGNTSYNFPGGGMLAHGQNYVGNTLGGSDTNAKIKAINDNLGHYGQESTKFYAGTGGGVEERMNALKEMNPTTTSSAEMAAYAAKEKGLMLDRLREKESQIRDVMGESYLQKHPVFTPELQKDIARIDSNVARLRSNAPAAASAAPAPIKPLDVGQATTINGVSIKRVN